MLAALTGTALGDAVVPGGAIVVAEDLLPSQLVALAAAKPAGLCLARGGPTSHVAIMFAGMGLPALFAMGEALDGVEDGPPRLLHAKLGHAPANTSPENERTHVAN